MVGNCATNPVCWLLPADKAGGALWTLRPVDAWQLGLGLCGFMMFKVAVLGVSLTAPDPASLEQSERALQKKVQQ